MNDRAPTISVRPSTGDDVAAIQAIYAYHVTHGLGSFEETPPSIEIMAERRREAFERGLPHLVAEVGGGIAGFAYTGPYRPRPAYRFTPAGPDHAQIAAVNGVMDYMDELYSHHFDAAASAATRAEAVRSLIRDQESLLLQPLLDFLADRQGVRLIGMATHSIWIPLRWLSALT